MVIKTLRPVFQRLRLVFQRLRPVFQRLRLVFQRLRLVLTTLPRVSGSRLICPRLSRAMASDTSLLGVGGEGGGVRTQPLACEVMRRR